MKKGKVYLAGAGPGDPGLITLRALEALEEADCVIYDFLANAGLIRREGLESIYVGKKGGDHTLPQEEIQALIIKKALEGKTVVRLKGGDPYIFGRGGEEAEELVKHGIPFEVIPGVSSFYSAPAYAGIPVTHRDLADRFEVITGHRRTDGPGDLEVTLPGYAPGKTFIFLMGMKNLASIARGLVEKRGFPESTPAAAVSWGTTARQKTATGTLATIASAAQDAGVKAPAVFIIGDVINLRETLRWFDNKPLFGKKIVVTRTREQASELSKKLARLGAEVVEFSTITIQPRKNTEDLDRAIDALPAFDWTIFTSQNAVRIFFDRLRSRGLDARAFQACRLAAIGPATARALEERSLLCDIVPGEFVAEALLEELEKQGVRGEKMLIPCAAEARDVLAEGLRSQGAEVTRVHLYDTVKPDTVDEALREAVESADMITFASSSTVRNFFSIFGKTEAKLACIGPVTAEAVRRTGKEPDVIAAEYTIDGLVDAIAGYCEREYPR